LPSEGKGHTFESCRVRQQRRSTMLFFPTEIDPWPTT